MNQLTTYDPFADTGIDELFRGFFRPVRFEKAGPTTIKMDVTEQDNAYVVKAEIPGVAKEDIQVSIEGNQVTIGAEVKREKDVKNGDRVLRTERYFGKLYRAFTLGQAVEESGTHARYADGVLELTLPKKAAAQAKRISIQ